MMIKMNSALMLGLGCWVQCQKYFGAHKGKMIAVRVDYDIYQVFGPSYSPRRRANKELVIVAKLTILIEVTGIRIAATTGSSSPRTEKYNPTKL